MVRLAQTDRRHAVELSVFDADPWKLNTPTGVIDLATGEERPHRRDSYMTKTTAAGPHGTASRWLQFLDEVTGGDFEQQRYLQRCVGYALTGLIREHVVLFLHGPGGNGKSVFLSIISDLLGSYAVTAPMDTFTVSRGERHPTELALLAGARLVTASETEQGRRWDEPKLKAITGGEKISARRMRQDFFEFSPQFTLFMSGNYLPGVRNVDHAMQRRIQIIPFKCKIPNPDKRLTETLRAELPGIMAWATEGCVAWQRDGLAPPKAVLDATSDYFESEDTIGRWLKERCHVGAQNTALTDDLFRDWHSWAERNREFVGGQRQFARVLENRGFARWRQKVTGRRGFGGLALLNKTASLDLDGQTGEEAWSPAPTDRSED